MSKFYILNWHGGQASIPSQILLSSLLPSASNASRLTYLCSWVEAECWSMCDSEATCHYALHLSAKFLNTQTKWKVLLCKVDVSREKYYLPFTLKADKQIWTPYVTTIQHFAPCHCYLQSNWQDRPVCSGFWMTRRQIDQNLLCYTILCQHWIGRQILVRSPQDLVKNLDANFGIQSTVKPRTEGRCQKKKSYLHQASLISKAANGCPVRPSEEFEEVSLFVLCKWMDDFPQPLDHL